MAEPSLDPNFVKQIAEICLDILRKGEILLKHNINKHGFVNIRNLMSFPEIKALTKEWSVVQRCLQMNSETFVLDSRKSVRLACGPVVVYRSEATNRIPEISTKYKAVPEPSPHGKELRTLVGSTKQEGKENSSDESNVAEIPGLSTTETNGELSKGEISASGSSTSSAEVPVLSSPSKPIAENMFSVAANNPDDQSSNDRHLIFGQNLHERALNYNNQNEKPSSPADSHNLTFKEAALKKEELADMERYNQKEKLKKSLSESAKEYESKQVKRKFNEVTVVTREEEESNVPQFQIICKLFAYDKVGMNWQERDRGILCIYDKDCRGNLNSRVVMRAQGSLRVVLNTKVWAGMSVEHPSKETVRLAAYDPQGVKLYLVKARANHAQQLFLGLAYRVAILKVLEKRKTLRNDSAPIIEEASPPNAKDKNYNSPSKQPKMEAESCYGVDSSSETNFVPRDRTAEGATDSTDVQS